MSKLTYRHTVIACFISYVVQAMIINYAPLLFVQFQHEFQLNLVELTGLISINFLVQLISDAVSIPLLSYLGYRWVGIIANFCAVVGFGLMVYLPSMMMSPLLALMIATVVYSIGGGLIEVVINPIVEAIPSNHNERMMSLLHSFYSWGFVGVVIISILFFTIFGITNWRVLTLLGAIVPLVATILFAVIPLPEIIEELDEYSSLYQLIFNPLFWCFGVMMFSAGASEMALSQWLSLFMEQSVGLSKVIGDLAGPLSFAMMMGIFRMYFGIGKHKMSVEQYIIICLIGLFMAIALMVLSIHPIISLLGSAVYGGAVGILWPGTYSIAAKKLRGGPAMFGLLALIGDLGCMCGPLLTGYVASTTNGNLTLGIATSAVFPILFMGVMILQKMRMIRQ